MERFSSNSPIVWTPPKTRSKKRSANSPNKVDKLDDQLATLLKKEREKDVEPRRWATRATRQAWDALIDWVDELNTSYSEQGRRSPPGLPIRAIRPTDQQSAHAADRGGAHPMRRERERQ